MATSEGLADWLRLQQTTGVGVETARKLLSAFGLPGNIFSAGFLSLCEIVSERVARALLAAPAEKTRTLINHSISWASQSGNHVLTLADASFPNALLEISDPPLLLYVKGSLDLLSRPAIAIVGSRNATAQGISNAEKFSEILSQSGLTVVSGMALGIDTAAHQGALRTGQRGGGSTIAVIGTGADIVYPARNRALAHQIAEGGCIVSEYALGTPAIAANFPRRNRIISGLARGVLVIEAAAQSGSLITARLAAEQGRDVFAIPGSIHSPLAKGCHQLIKQGAKLVESAQDILEEFQYPEIGCAAATHGHSTNSKDPFADRVLVEMGFDPVDLGILAMRCDTGAAALSVQLLDLELEGLIEILPGGMYRRLAGSS